MSATTTRALVRSFASSAAREAKYPPYAGAGVSQYDALNSQHFHYSSSSNTAKATAKTTPSPAESQAQHQPKKHHSFVPHTHANLNVWKSLAEAKAGEVIHRRRSKFGLFGDAVAATPA